jgi:hypothetical protein
VWRCRRAGERNVAVVDAVLKSGLFLQSAGSVRQTRGLARRVREGVPERAEAVNGVGYL